MCRLLGLVATRPAPIAELVGDDLEPFLQLACEHKDGWGVAFRDELGAVSIVKGTDRADGSELLRGVLASCVTDMAMIHLRMASPNLPVSMENTHPFGDARAAFAHNGEIRPRAALTPLVSPDLLATARGTTDSELYFLAIRERMNQGFEVAPAIAATATSIRARADLAVSLNCMMLTPEGLFTYAGHDPDSEVISRRGPGYFGLSYRQEEGLALVASQGWPQPGWKGLPERSVAEFTPGQARPRVRQPAGTPS